MAITFSCQSCGKSYSQPESNAGKKARCQCGAIFTVPHTPAPEPDEGAYELVPDEPVHQLPTGAARVFQQPGAYAPGFSREAPPPLRPSSPEQQRSSPRGSSRAARTPATRSSASGGGSSLAKIGGGIFSVLVVLGALVKVVRLATGGSEDDATYTQREASRVDQSISGPPAVTRVESPARVEPTSHGEYQSARIDVSNSAGSVTHLEVMLPPGTHQKGSLPCVFVAPAGSNLLTGNALEPDYTDESLPYVKAGFACVRYSLSGPLANKDPSDEEFLRAFNAFRAAHGGVSDGSAAIDTVLANYPEIDPTHLYTAGHSSAGTAALLVAHKDARIRAAIAYAPVLNLELHFREAWSELIKFPGFEAFVSDTSPNEQGPPRTPVMLFHARDDKTVPALYSENYHKVFPSKVKLVTVLTGNHYESMIKDGIPAGIRFIQGDLRGR